MMRFDFLSKFTNIIEFLGIEQGHSRGNQHESGAEGRESGSGPWRTEEMMR